MSFQFNPLTGLLERQQAPSGGSTVIYGRREVVVDAAFLLLPEIDLGLTPSVNSDITFLNGLQVGTACYTITANIFSWNDSSELREGDTIFIRYNG